MEGWHKVDVAAVFHCQGQLLEILGAIHETNALAPLDGGSCDFNGALKCILLVVSDLVAESCQQTIL